MGKWPHCRPVFHLHTLPAQCLPVSVPPVFTYLVHSVFLRDGVELRKENIEQRHYRHRRDALADLDEADHVTEQNRHLIE